MFGGGEGKEGVIPRAASDIFESIGRSTEAREFSITASFLEIYREQLRDLLNPGGPKLAIREAKRKIYVENLSEEFVTQQSDVMECDQTKVSKQ